MEHVHIQRKGDQEKLFKYRDMFKAFSNDELIDSYNRSVDTGIIGSHEQALHLISLRWVFNERFGKSPIKIKDNILISLSGKILQEEDSYTEMQYVRLRLTDGHFKYVYIDLNIELNSGFIDVKSLIKADGKALLLRFSIDKMNTQLVLTDVSPYVLLYFDEFLQFTGASYSNNSGGDSFVIQTQYKTILLIKLPLYFDLNEIIQLEYNE